MLFHRLSCLFAAVCAFSGTVGETDQKLDDLTLVFLIPADQKEAIGNTTSSAIVVALNDLDEYNLTVGRRRYADVSWELRNSRHVPSAAVSHLMEIRKSVGRRIGAVFGGYSEETCDTLRLLSVALNVPFFGIRCHFGGVWIEPSLPTMGSAAKPSVSAVGMLFCPWSLGPLIVGLLHYFGWNRVAILATSDPHAFHLGSTLKSVLASRDTDAFLFICTISTTDGNPTSAEDVDALMQLMTQIKTYARVIVLTMVPNSAARILQIAKSRLNMYDGEYVFVMISHNWVDPDAVGMTAKEWARLRVGLFSVEVYFGEARISFIPRINTVPRRNRHFKDMRMRDLLPDNSGNVALATNLYLAILLYFHALERVLEKFKSGPEFDIATAEYAQLILNESVNVALPDTRAGSLYMASDGNREGSGVAINVNSTTGKSNVIMTYEVTRKLLTRGTATAPLTWLGGSRSPPELTPRCGWGNSECGLSTEVIMISVSTIMGALAIAGIPMALIHARRSRHKMESHIVDECNVKWSNVTLLGDMYTTTSGKESTNENASNVTESRIQTSFDGGRDKSKCLRTAPFSFTGTYKGKTVSIKPLNRDSVDLYQPDIYKELKQIYYVNHENLNEFIGVCTEAPNVCVLMLYADRGSLQDVLADEKYNVNWKFRVCVAYDIAKGMEYMHESPVGPHGHLTSSNCVIDRKWTCKITDYGLKQFKRPKTAETSSSRRCAGLLWTAPEILRSPENDTVRVNGTKEGDVYSFGIIVFELMTREVPFERELETKSIDDIVTTVMTTPTVRPGLPPADSDIGTHWNGLAELCWSERPDDRPNFKTVRQKLGLVNGGNIPNLMERIQMMMTSELDATHNEVETERIRNLALFKNSIPDFRALSDKILEGRYVPSLAIETITLSICDTAGCYKDMYGILPTDMVATFESLHAVFDKIFTKFNIQEVSNRGCKDSMMLAAGHLSSDERHAEKMCDAALELVTELLQFKSPAIPNASFNAYITIHSGKVMSSLMGSVLPRYCIFGDVIPTINALHASNKEMQIMISQATYQLIRPSGSFSVGKGGQVKMKNSKKVDYYWLRAKIDPGYRK